MMIGGHLGQLVGHALAPGESSVSLAAPELLLAAAILETEY